MKGLYLLGHTAARSCVAVLCRERNWPSRRGNDSTRNNAYVEASRPGNKGSLSLRSRRAIDGRCGGSNTPYESVPSSWANRMESRA